MIYAIFLFVLNISLCAKSSEIVLKSLTIESHPLWDSLIISALQPLAPVVMAKPPYGVTSNQLKLYFPQTRASKTFLKQVANMSREPYTITVRATNKPLPGTIVELTYNPQLYRCSLKHHYPKSGHAFRCELLKTEKAKKIAQYVVNKTIA